MVVVITQRRSFSSWWKEACEKEANLESTSWMWMWVVSEQSTQRASSIQTRKDPDCHQMKFKYYPISNTETEVKRGSAVISFWVQKYFSNHRRLASKSCSGGRPIFSCTRLCSLLSHCSPASVVLWFLNRPSSLLPPCLWRHSMYLLFEMLFQPHSIAHSFSLLLSRFSHVWLFVILWTVAHQAPLSTGFSRQEYWSGLPFRRVQLNISKRSSQILLPNLSHSKLILLFSTQHLIFSLFIYFWLTSVIRR